MRRRQIALLCAFSLFAGNCAVPVDSAVWAASKSPVLNKKKVSVRNGKTVKLSLKRAKGFKITWKSKNKKIAAVKKSGKYGAKVTGKRVGRTQITASLKKGKTSYSLKCKVTVISTGDPSRTVLPSMLPSVAPFVPASTAASTATTMPSGDVPTQTPAAGETAEPTGQPGDVPTEKPGMTPTEKPGTTPTEKPGTNPTEKPGMTSTEKPGTTPTEKPGTIPTEKPTTEPTANPTAKPTGKPTANPTEKPTATPTEKPTANPTNKPTANPTNKPAVNPTEKPAANPTESPTNKPVVQPTVLPSVKPTLPPAEIEDGVNMFLTADTCLDAALPEQPVYNKDGSVTVKIAKQYGGGGICFYIDPSKEKVDLSEYSKAVIDVTAEAAAPICVNQYPGSSFWDGAVKTLAYADVATERKQISVELTSDEVYGIGIRYAAWNQSAVAEPLTLTIHSITLIKDTRDTSDALNNYSSLCSLAQAHGFKMGTVFNTRTATDKKYGELMKYHFNSITAANEMKAYSMLDEVNSKKNYSDETSMPVLNFTNADVVMDYAKNSGLKVRGHVLVWDADMCDWFFREGYDTQKPYASAEVVTSRLKNYIEQVLVHFEEKYPGIVYCWDVVNEAVSDAGEEHNADDERMVRTTRDGKVNRFYEILGDHYVESSFRYTYEIIQKYKDTYPTMADIKLYYNDFSTFYPTKRDAICKLIQSINSTLPDGSDGYVKLCDGMGMQSYIGGFGHQDGCMNDNDIALVKEAINKFADCGVEVQVTELAVRNYENDENTIKTHGEFYKKLFRAYMDINSERADHPLKAVSIWGIVDRPDMVESDYSYRMNGPFCGLFDEKLGVKPAFIQVHDLMKETAGQK